ncbi:MAG: aspartate--tRNA ligase [Planctomycetota bacterium]|jgi:aspartyl-tRNA synthetase
MASWQRTHTCGELTPEHADREVTLNGWIENNRHHGSLLFIDLRDRYGVTQLVFDEDIKGTPSGLLEVAGKLGAEDVISVTGRVALRDEDKINPKRSTGAVEVYASELTVLQEAETPPFEVLDNPEAGEELRIRYRYLDLRRRPMLEAMEKRAAFVTAVRNYLAEHQFIDVETPILTKSTPEGARDYLVPSRVNPGKFFALPQSPQIFKQLMMVAGADRYYQIARCFRDEDLRADRQPEFTQIDLEMSFVEEEDVLQMVEGMIIAAFKKAFDADLAEPFVRLDYEEAMRRYGSDKPDLRFEMELNDISEIAAKSDFKVFSGAIENKGQVKGLCLKGQAENFSRKAIDALTAFVGEYGARGLAWGKVGPEGITGPIGKFYGGAAGEELLAAMDAAPGDLILFVADRPSVVTRALGELRLKLGTDLGLRTPGDFRFAWVTNFPLFLYNEEHGRYDSSHHPFTAPVDWDLEDFSKDTDQIRSRAYDLVMNGWELGSGSIRIHRREVQERVFEFLGVGEAEQQAKFGFLLEAFRYGAPPHGGIALGVDRLVALALGCESIREVIAFPKTASATDLLCDAPGDVAPEQLADLHILTQKPKSRSDS